MTTINLAYSYPKISNKLFLLESYLNLAKQNYIFNYAPLRGQVLEFNGDSRKLAYVGMDNCWTYAQVK